MASIMNCAAMNFGLNNGKQLWPSSEANSKTFGKNPTRNCSIINGYLVGGGPRGEHDL
jgi:hypothetical protein